jgi:acetylglutamate kinase
MTVVVKLGGRVQSDPRLAGAIRSLWDGHPGSLCIVHGGGDEVTALQRQLGREPQFIGGRRVTTEEDLSLLRMVLSGTANKRLVAALGAERVPAVGISGEDAGLLPSRAIDPEKFGKAGKPLTPDVRLILSLLANGFLPVISPVGTDADSEDNGPLNINGDDAAASIAAALGAELWMIADVSGVLDQEKQTISVLDPAQVDALVASGVVNSGMQAKLEAGFAAIQAGAPAVRIASLEAFTDSNAGTVLTLSPSLR